MSEHSYEIVTEWRWELCNHHDANELRLCVKQLLEFNYLYN